MSVDIFIRSYIRDFAYLKYCLYSIEKYVTGYNKIIICVRSKDLRALNSEINTNKYTVVTDHDFADSIDYLGQQYSKLHTDIWSNADYCMYVDSDTVFTEPCDIKESYFLEDKLIVLYDEWNNIGDSKCWMKCLNYLNIISNYEFMRRMPIIFPVKILKQIREYISKKCNKIFIDACIHVYKNYKFSEFNIIGSYIYKYDRDSVTFMLPKDNPKRNICKQFWSYGNKKLIISEMMKILNIEIPL